MPNVKNLVLMTNLQNIISNVKCPKFYLKFVIFDIFQFSNLFNKKSQMAKKISESWKNFNPYKPFHKTKRGESVGVPPSDIQESIKMKFCNQERILSQTWMWPISWWTVRK